MKIRKSAIIEEFNLNGKNIPVSDNQSIALEFSALDTGGRFEDRMLDFSFVLDHQPEHISIPETKTGECELTISDPSTRNKRCKLEASCHIANGENLEINGRITEEDLKNEVAGFVINLKG